MPLGGGSETTPPPPRGSEMLNFYWFVVCCLCYVLLFFKLFANGSTIITNPIRIYFVVLLLHLYSHGLSNGCVNCHVCNIIFQQNILNVMGMWQTFAKLVRNQSNLPRLVTCSKPRTQIPWICQTTWKSTSQIESFFPKFVRISIVETSGLLMFVHRDKAWSSNAPNRRFSLSMVHQIHRVDAWNCCF